MELIFVRHGETVYNKNKQLMGQRIDASLDSDGINQVKAILQKIPTNFTIIYSSPLKRAAETAQLISDHFEKNVQYRHELLERDFGSLSGKTWQQINSETGKPASELDTNLQYDYSEYGGESVADVKKRLKEFISEMKQKHPNDRVVVVAHRGIINLMESLYQSQEHNAMDNASIHTFVF